jgi:hypothetical protein
MEFIPGVILLLIVFALGIAWRIRAAKRERVPQGESAGGARARDQKIGIADIGVVFIMGWFIVSLLVGMIPVLVAVAGQNGILALEIFYLTLLVAAGIGMAAVAVLVLGRLLREQR